MVSLIVINIASAVERVKEGAGPDDRGVKRNKPLPTFYLQPVACCSRSVRAGESTARKKDNGSVQFL